MGRKTVSKKQNKRKTRKNGRTVSAKGGNKCDTEFIINSIKDDFKNKLEDLDKMEVGDFFSFNLTSGENKFYFDISIKKIAIFNDKMNINELLKVVALSGFNVENVCEKYDKKIFTELLTYFIKETKKMGYQGFMIDEFTLDNTHRKKVIKKLGFILANEYENFLNKEYILLFKDYSSFTIRLPKIDTSIPLEVRRRLSRKKRQPKSYEYDSSLKLSPAEIPESPDRPFFPMDEDEDKYEKSYNETDEDIQLRKDMERLRDLGYING